MTDEQRLADDLWWNVLSCIVTGLEQVYRREDADVVAMAFYEGRLRFKFTNNSVGMEILAEGAPVSPN